MTRHRLTLLLFVLLAISITACQPVRLLNGHEARAEQDPTSGTEIVPSPTEPPPTPTMTATVTETSTPLPTPTELPTATPVPATSTPIPATATATPTSEPEPPTPTYPPPPESVNVPVLMYHYISEIPEDADVYRRELTVTPPLFEAQMRHLSEQGYHSVTLADVYETLSSGKPLPDNPIVLTFDDGYRDAYTEAMPILQQYGFIGEFFVLATPAHYESPRYLSWDQVRQMADAGMSIQPHGRDHKDLTQREYDFLVYQILGAKEAVESHTDRPVTFFCYPSGRHDEDARAVVASAGYLGAVTTVWGTELRLDNRYEWPRIRIKGNWSIELFAQILDDLQP